MEKRAQALLRRAEKVANSFTSTVYFQQMCDRAFDECDLDGSGQIDVKEVYCAVLTLYLNITKVVSAASPPPRQRVETLFTELDADCSSALSREEFKSLAVILCQEIAGRLAVESAFTFGVGPLLAFCAVYVLGLLLDVSQFGDKVSSVVVTLLETLVVLAVGVCLMPRIITSYVSRYVDGSAKARRKAE
eukprot:TRINITY_DN18864_c0_g1_i1.p1 TRINITY_DN18864_c0_g1~~TRINITY_DN18864_c0_g1_i1.p1  ORF type:complete len:190 (+),score=41.26 TRINITY_DN18864_c0_g1_i1:81-650(+)